MAEIVRNFIAGSMNKDVDERLLQNGQYRDGLNIKVGTSETGNVGSVQNDMGNERLSDLADITGLALENARTISALPVPGINCVYWLVTSDLFDGIFELNREDNTVTRVLQCNKLTPTTPSKLNFNPIDLITGIDYIGGMLFFTDLRNGPRKINIARCKSYSVDDPMIDKDISLIIAPPLYAPRLDLMEDDSQQTNMQDKFLYFAYRFKYTDNEYSSLSPFSSVAFGPNEYVYNPAQGYNKAMTNKYGTVSVSVETGNELVTDIQIIMYDTASKNTFIVETLNKDTLNLSSNTSYTFLDFSNNKVYTSLQSNQITRLFDNVPLGAKAQTIIGNRLIFGNIIQFRDVKDSNGNDIKVNFTVDYVNDIASPTLSNPLPTWKSNRDYELALVYLDEYGRMTTGLTSLNNTVYIKHQDHLKSNSLLINITNKAPEWATHWRMYIKQSKDEYYTIYPLLFYKEGTYRYFLLNNVDRDKIAEGDYIVFKSDNGGPSFSGKEYKVLEVAQKPANFLGGNSSTELAGLYFKIKADNNSELSPNTLFQYSSIGEGCNSTSATTFNPGENAFPPITGTFNYAENAIFYGQGNGSAMTSVNAIPIGYSQSGLRWTIEIDSPTTFRYTTSLDGAGPFVEENVPIVLNTDIPLYLPGNGPTSSFPMPSFNIRFNTLNGLVVNDKWKVCTRTAVNNGAVGTSYFGGNGLCDLSINNSSLSGGYAIVPGEGWSEFNGPNEIDRPILVGAIITLGIIEDRYNPAGWPGVMQFPPSDATYANIEEWFVESGAYQMFHQYNDVGTDVGAGNVNFRRGGLYQYQGGSNGGDLTNTVFAGGGLSGWSLNLPIRMFIMGYGTDNGPDNQNHIRVEFKIQQQTNQNIIETVPKINESDIFHELTRTHRVGEGGVHLVNWHYDDFIFFGDPDASLNGRTGLTQLTPYEPHTFNVGDSVNVVTTVPWLNGQHEIIAIPDLYTVVVDVVFAAPGPVTGGYLEANDYDLDQSSNSPQGAMIIVNNPNNKNDSFNAWSFGNGIESNRKKDDFNARTLEYSQRATSNIEDYKQVHNENELVWSGVYQQTTSVNRLNEFNLSTVNFKYADKMLGSIQLLHARDTDLLMFQEHKVSSVLYGKNLLSDSIGGGQVASIPEVLGTIIALPYENGISKNPESFTVYGQDLFFTDSYRGAVIQMSGNGMEQISSFGMRNYFKDMFLEGLNKRKLGAFDPFTKTYVLGSNNISTDECYLNVSKTRIIISAGAFDPIPLFEIDSNSTWSIELIADGFGTGWLTVFPESGSKDSKIKGTITANGTGADRNLIIRVTYCGGLTLDIEVIQLPEKPIVIGNIYFINENEIESQGKV